MEHTDATTTRARPVALAPGAGGFVLAWVGGILIARLTGASAVLLVLAAMLAAFVCALLDGRRQVRRVEVVEVTLPSLVEVGVAVACTVTVQRERSTNGAVRVRLLPSPDTADVDEPLTIRFETAGVVDRVEVEVAAAGIAGLVWWTRRTSVAVGRVHVAPTPQGPVLPIETSPTSLVGDGTTRRGGVRAEIDGVRPWRDGETVEAVHWPTTVRSGGLMVHDHTTATETRWTVTTPAPADAGRLHETLRQGLLAGHDVRLVDAGGNEPAAIPTLDDAARASAGAAGRAIDAPRESLWHREFQLRRRRPSLEPFATVRPPARWLTALASWSALSMLVGALSGSPATMLLIATGLALGAIVTTVFVDDHGDPPLVVRVAVVLASLGALGLIAVESSGITGLLAALRGPLPNLLMMLVVLHGFEASNRRTVRVHQAIGAAVVLYAAGLRIDGALGWWLAAWGIAVIAAVIATAATSPHPSRRSVVVGTRSIAWIALGAALTLGVLAVVPVPSGPASLGLPALSNGAPTGGAGALVGPGGTTSSSTPSTGTRGALGEVGGYRGFTETLDTAIRGDLSDEIVMRVRSPEAAFWRGQTFTDFDGRTWTVSPEMGRPNEGPSIIVEPTLGDGVDPAIPTDQLVQTYFIEADLPNVVFAAARPDTVIFDGSVWTRPDGALRSDVTLGDGSVYTVVSQRARVDTRRAPRAGRRRRRVRRHRRPASRRAAGAVSGGAGIDHPTHEGPRRRPRRRRVDVRHDPRLPGLVGRQHRLRPRRARAGGGGRRRGRLPVRVASWLLRADRLGAHRHVAYAGGAGSARHRLPPRRARPGVGRVEGAGQRCPRVGRGVVPRHGVAGVRPDRRRTAGRRRGGEHGRARRGHRSVVVGVVASGGSRRRCRVRRRDRRRLPMDRGDREAPSPRSLGPAAGPLHRARRWRSGRTSADEPAAGAGDRVARRDPIGRRGDRGRRPCRHRGERAGSRCVRPSWVDRDDDYASVEQAVRALELTCS